MFLLHVNFSGLTRYESFGYYEFSFVDVEGEDESNVI